MRHIIIAIIFGFFALFQWNDPDFYLWGSIYLMVAVIALLAASNRFYKRVYLILCLILGIWMCFYIPQMVQWIKDGMPSIVTSMKAESPYIELTREFFGLIICIATIWYYYQLSKKVK